METSQIPLTSARKSTKLSHAQINPALPTPASQLSHKQRLFVLEYLMDFNITQAAVRAGYSKRSAAKTGLMMLREPNIAQYVTDVMSVRLQRLDQDSSKLLLELARLAHVDVGTAFRPDGSLLPLQAMHEDVRRCISGLETEETYETRYEDGSGKAEDELEPVLVRTVIRKVKFWDKNKAADTLAKCMKLYAAGSTVNVNVTLEQLVMQSIGQSIEAKPASQASAVLAATQQPALEHQPGAALTHAADNATATPAPGVGSRAGLVDSSEEQP